MCNKIKENIGVVYPKWTVYVIVIYACNYLIINEKASQRRAKLFILFVDQIELIHGISLSLLAKYLPFCIDSLCSRNVAANWLVYDRYSDYLLKAHSLSSSEYKVRTFCLYLQIFVI